MKLVRLIKGSLLLISVCLLSGTAGRSEDRTGSGTFQGRTDDGGAINTGGDALSVDAQGVPLRPPLGGSATDFERQLSVVRDAYIAQQKVVAVRMEGGAEAERARIREALRRDSEQLRAARELFHEQLVQAKVDLLAHAKKLKAEVAEQRKDRKGG